MSKKSESFYFDNFAEAAALAREAAVFLEEVLTNFNPEVLPDALKKMHTIEQRGDEKKHALISELFHAFITPIEREDIISLSSNMDDVTDSIEDILIHIYMNNVTVIRPDSIEFASLLVRCCTVLNEMLIEFKNFKKPKRISELIVEINKLEEEGDAMYMRMRHLLHTTSKDPFEVIAWREIYSYFEKCCDACEHVADIVEGIIVGNT